MADAPDHSSEADWIEGLPLPREQTALLGHDDAAATLHEAYRSGRMHHAWLISGPKGIGKATLAFRFARFALSHPDPALAPPVGDRPLLPFDPRIAAQVATGAHPNLLHLRRPYDEKEKKLKTLLTVDEVRRSVGFFGTSAGSRGDRIAIVDAADDMNPAAANALLKMLEEPPARSIFLVLSHAPGRLLPTIRSRCRRLALEPLSIDALDAAVDALGLAVEEADKPLIAAIAEGSVRRACDCVENDGLTLYRAFSHLAAGFPAMDRAGLHRLGEMAAGRRGDGTFPLLVDMARGYLSARLHDRPGEPPAALHGLAEAWAAIDRIAGETEALNLDRKQAVIELMQSLAESRRI